MASKADGKEITDARAFEGKGALSEIIPEKCRFFQDMKWDYPGN